MQLKFGAALTYEPTAASVKVYEAERVILV
jgi:hypothetical protein